jgi:hypothetical protein
MQSTVRHRLLGVTQANKRMELTAPLGGALRSERPVRAASRSPFGERRRRSSSAVFDARHDGSGRRGVDAGDDRLAASASGDERSYLATQRCSRTAHFGRHDMTSACLNYTSRRQS